MRCPTVPELPPPPEGKADWPWTTEAPALEQAMPDGNPWPRISVVTPSFNQGAFLEETIRSVLLQGYPNLEYIVIDGASTDNTCDVLKKYEPWLTYWTSEQDNGQSDAINKGWHKSKGEIIAYLNSDDVYCPGAFAIAVEHLVKHPDVGMVHADSHFINEPGRLLRQHKGREVTLEDVLCWSSHISQPTVFLRRAVIDCVGMMDVGLHYAMDFDLWIRVAVRYQIKYLPCFLAKERHHRLAKTTAAPQDGLLARIVAIERLFSRIQQPQIVAMKSKAMATHYLQMAWYCLGRRNMSIQAKVFARKALTLSPPLSLFLKGWMVQLLAVPLDSRLGVWAREIKQQGRMIR
jgi:hypothetical protein